MECSAVISPSSCSKYSCPALQGGGMDLEGADSPAPRERIKHRGPGRDPGHKMPAPEDVSTSTPSIQIQFRGWDIPWDPSVGKTALQKGAVDIASLSLIKLENCLEPPKLASERGSHPPILKGAEGPVSLEGLDPLVPHLFGEGEAPPGPLCKARLSAQGQLQPEWDATSAGSISAIILFAPSFSPR